MRETLSEAWPECEVAVLSQNNSSLSLQFSHLACMVLRRKRWKRLCRTLTLGQVLGVVLEEAGLGKRSPSGVNVAHFFSACKENFMRTQF